MQVTMHYLLESVLAIGQKTQIGRIHGAIVAAIVAATGRSDLRGVRRSDSRGDDRPVYTAYKAV